MKSLMKFGFGIIGFVCLAVVSGLWFGLDHYPLVARESRLSPQETRQVKRLLARHDPRYLKDGEMKTLVLNQKNLRILGDYFVEFLGGGGTNIRMDHDRLNAQFTIKPPANPFGSYLNLELAMSQDDKLPRIDAMRVGKITLPSWIVDRMFHLILKKLEVREERSGRPGLLRRVAIANHQVVIAYRWDAEFAEEIQEAVVSEDEQQRLRVYHFKLVEIMGKLSVRQRHPLVTVMQPLFQLARERSLMGDPALENRAIILVLAASAHGPGIRRLVPTARDWPLPKRHSVTVGGRVDWAKHFIISAALTLVGGDMISEAIGVFKEVEDSRIGSGFSFADLAADKAGTRFGIHATSTDHAIDVQRRLALTPRESDVVPRLTDLPEWLSEREWIQRYGGLESQKYQAMEDEIDRRIERLPLYSPMEVALS